MSNSICLFAAYAPDGTLPPYTIHYLSELRQCGFIIHVALAGNGSVSSRTRDICTTQGIHVWPRPNIGHDFGSWQFLIDQGCCAGAQRVLLANDSVFGPFRPLAPIMQSMRSKDASVWGMVGSASVIPHIQSWFLCFEWGAFFHPAVQYIFRQPFADMNRQELIWHAELAIGAACSASGLRMEACWQDWQTLLGRLVPTNPMHTRWKRFAAGNTVPFIKTELLRDNPFRLSSTRDWRDIIPTDSRFDPLWIVDYLRSQPSRENRLPDAPNAKGKLLYRLVETWDRFLAGLQI